MRVEDRKIGREGTNLGGLGLAETISVLSDPGCFRSGDLVVEACWDSGLVVSRWSGRFPVRPRNRRPVAQAAVIPKARPNQHLACGGVSVFTLVDAANGFHVGY